MRKKWQINTREPILGFSLFNFPDIDTISNTHYIIAYTKTGKILVINKAGILIKEKYISEEMALYALKCFDLTSDGIPELIIGGADGYLRVFRVTKRWNFSLLWEHKFNSIISGIIIKKLENNDQFAVIAYSLDNTLRVLNSSDGSLIWAQMFEEGINESIIYQDSLSKEKKIIACGNDGTIRVFNAIGGNLEWFLKYSNKIRSIAVIKINNNDYIIAGGDDKILYYIDMKNRKKISEQKFKNYIWFIKSLSSKLLVSSYSFAFFQDKIPLKSIHFTSRFLYFNILNKTSWEIIGLNIECYFSFHKEGKDYLILGSTKGIIAVIEEQIGRIISHFIGNSCVNDIKYISDNDLIISCHDNGEINAYSFNDL